MAGRVMFGGRALRSGKRPEMGARRALDLAEEHTRFMLKEALLAKSALESAEEIRQNAGESKIHVSKAKQYLEQLNYAGRALEWKYLRRLKGLGVDTEKVGKLASAARAAAQQAITHIREWEIAIDVQKQSGSSGFLSSKLRKYSPSRIFFSDPQTRTQRTIAILIKDLQDANDTIQKLRAR